MNKWEHVNWHHLSEYPALLFNPEKPLSWHAGREIIDMIYQDMDIYFYRTDLPHFRKNIVYIYKFSPYTYTAVHDS